MVDLPIYLDNNATTRVDPRVLETMLPFFSERYGNAASRSHPFGWAAEDAVQTARAQVAALIGARPEEIVWTSGATEADNLALKGVAEMYAGKGDHIVTQATEHKAILDAARHLEQQGKRVTYLRVDRDGFVDLNELREAITDQTILVSIMYGNNEIGTLQPLEEIGQICRERGVLFHTDATQAVGKVPVDVDAMNIDLLSCSAHKMYGPKGIGALYVRRRNPRVRLAAQIDGGGHERQMRSGTLNVPGIVGFGQAAELCRRELEDESVRLACLRDRLRDGLLDAIEGTALNGHPTRRLPHNLNLSFADIESDALLLNLSDIALSSGSACTSASIAPSYVLKAIGLSDAQAHSSLRFGLSRWTTEEEINYTIDRLAETVSRLRAVSGPKALAHA